MGVFVLCCYMVSMEYKEVVIWSLWNIRNRMVFKNFKPDWELEMRQIKVRWGFWLKSWLEVRNNMPSALVSNPLALRRWRWLNSGRNAT